MTGSLAAGFANAEIMFVSMRESLTARSGVENLFVAQLGVLNRAEVKREETEPGSF